MRFRGTTYEYCTGCKQTRECSVDVGRSKVTCRTCGTVLFQDRAAVVERANFPKRPVDVDRKPEGT